MMRILIEASLCLLLAAALWAGEATVELRGVEVEVLTGHPELDAHRTEGTSIALLVEKPEGGIISFSEELSVIEKVWDSKGRDLTKPPDGEPEESSKRQQPRFGRGPRISKDGSSE
jgi:hypothetical protein